MNNLKLIKFIFLFVIFCNVMVDVSHKILLQNVAFKIFDGSEQVVLISIINALILLPFLLLFSTSGYISDKYDKKDVMVYGALSSFCLSALMIVAYATSSFYLAMFVLLLLAVQSAIYSPAKFAMIIHLYKKENLGLGNSLVQAVSMIAILLSIGLFSFLFENMYVTNNMESIMSKEALLHEFLPLSFYIALVGFLEMLASFLVLKKVQTDFEFDVNKRLDTQALLKGKLLQKNIQEIKGSKLIFLCVIGLSVFWGVSQGLLAVFPAYAKEYLHITDVFVINGVLAASGIGIAIGSTIYSKLAKNYIETGTIPFAAFGLALMIYLATYVDSAYGLMMCFLVFGIFGGLFVVPLNALIQFNSNISKMGTILAGNNWFQSVFMVTMLIITSTVALMNLDTLNTLYLILVITVLGAFYTVYKLPQSMVYFFVKFVVGLRYKLEVNGLKNVPSTGGVLLLGNHVSWLDWAILQMSMPRPIKFVMHKGIYDKWYLTWFLKFFDVIPIAQASSRQTIKTVAKELDEGSLVVLFPEGSITRNGHLGEFKRGFELILKQTQENIPVVAFYIRGLWESMFSRANKKFIESYRTNRVTVSFSKPLDTPNAQSLKQKVMKLAITSWEEHVKLLDTIPNEVFAKLKELGKHRVVSDSTGVELSGHKFLTACILFKDLLKQRLKGENIALLVPTSAAGAFINTSVLMLGKKAINLNYTASVESLILSVQSANVQSVVASKQFIHKLKAKGIDLTPLLDTLDVIYLEDLKKEISKPKGLLTFLSVRFLPTVLLQAVHIKRVSLTDTALIMFSSGSEGTPKGIELSHMNIVGNTQQIASVLNVHDKDVMMGSLPLFHGFGICVTTLLPLIEGIPMVAHPDPTDGLGIAQMVQKYKATIMCGTSTFYRLYAMNKKVDAAMFESLRFVVAGAEKLSTKVREDFRNKFHKEILEGYGTTETSPVASCNLPDVLAPDESVQKGEKRGSVGLPLPGTSFKVVDPQSYEELAVDEEGMVLIGGVQVMKGYLNNDAKTNSVIKSIDGKSWYVTGDKGKLDADGFLTIVDRYSRFAKLAGEMISLGAVEEKIVNLIQKEEVDQICTAIKDDKKGEKLIFLISGLNEEELEMLKKEVVKHFDNKLMIPSEYYIVPNIPKLGTGKKDFAQAKQLAQELS
jgi:acyl-[acyl-carrier-protein]-phospholipid O-acyltransferase/long-chain-fatty-acid--[acyl-carrier-protein] ligase